MNRVISGSRQQKQKHWEKHIASWMRSDMTQREYCDARGLSFPSFSYWRNKLNKSSRPQPQFFPLTVQVPEEPAPGISTATGRLDLLVCDKRFCISIEREFNKQVLQQLILTLEDM